MGLGTCLIGFTVAALEKEPSLKTACGIARDERVHAAVALGWPAAAGLVLWDLFAPAPEPPETA